MSACAIAVLLAGCGSVQHRPSVVVGRHAEEHFVALKLSSQPTAPTGSVSRLVAGKWSALPQAPIAPRADAAVVWTGRELLVWGGASGYQGENLRSDGAAYNPAADRWRLLAPAPLSGRQGQAAVWTGREVFVWGGYDHISAHDFRVADDGAAYDPSSNTWRLLPPAPEASSGTTASPHSTLRREPESCSASGPTMPTEPPERSHQPRSRFRLSNRAGATPARRPAIHRQPDVRRAFGVEAVPGAIRTPVRYPRGRAPVHPN